MPVTNKEKQKTLQPNIRHKIVAKLQSDYVVEFRIHNKRSSHYYVEIKFCNSKRSGFIQLRNGGFIILAIRSHGQETPDMVGVNPFQKPAEVAQAYKSFYAWLEGKG